MHTSIITPMHKDIPHMYDHAEMHVVCTKALVLYCVGGSKVPVAGLYLKDSCLCSICQLGQIEHMFYLP